MTPTEHELDSVVALLGIDGVCCSCGYDGQRETECKQRDDRTHCEHWWDGPAAQARKEGRA